MGTRRVLVIAFAFALLIGVSALAQGPPMEWDGTPTAEEIRALDISIGPTGENSRRKRHCQGGRAGLSREGMRGMPRRGGDRRYGAQSKKQRSQES
jgi:hypothetical protein